MEEVYNQDCGGYTVNYQPVDPSCDMSGLLIESTIVNGGALSKYTYALSLTL